MGKSLYIVDRGMLTPPPPILWRLSYIAYPPPPLFSNFVPSLPSSLSPNHTVLFVVLFLWLNGWSHHIWCAILLNDNMNLHMFSLGTLVPEGAWCVFYATRCQVYWGLTHDVVFYCYSDFFITHTNAQKHTTHSGASRLTHLYKYILTPPVVCSWHLPLLQ